MLLLVFSLVGNGANIQATDPQGRSSLHYATLLGNLEITEFLLEKGARDILTDRAGRLACHEALYGRHIAVARAIAQAGVDIHRCDKRGKTAESLACELGVRLDMVLTRALLSHNDSVLGKLEEFVHFARAGKVAKSRKRGKRLAVKEDWSWLGADTFDPL